jgi:hypothetical protein
VSTLGQFSCLLGHYLAFPIVALTPLATNTSSATNPDASSAATTCRLPAHFAAPSRLSFPAQIHAYSVYRHTMPKEGGVTGHSAYQRSAKNRRSRSTKRDRRRTMQSDSRAHHANAECAPKRKRCAGLWLVPASSLKEKPGAALSLVDPGLKQTGGCNILIFVTATIVKFGATRESSSNSCASHSSSEDSAVA